MEMYPFFQFRQSTDCKKRWCMLIVSCFLEGTSSPPPQYNPEIEATIPSSYKANNSPIVKKLLDGELSIAGRAGEMEYYKQKTAPIYLLPF